MALKQEQIVALAAVGLLALLWWNARPDEGVGSRGGPRSTGDPRVFEHHAPPAIDIVLADPDAPAPMSFGERSLFEPPRNTRPLPPLAMVDPPRASLPGLFPPPSPGPAPRHFGRFLRRDARPTYVGDLFVDTDEDGVFDFALSGQEGEEDGGREGPSLEDQLREMGFLDDAPSGGDEPLISPEQRAALLEGYKELYDWIDLNSASWPFFGRIENGDRYALKTAAGEADDIKFSQLVDWRTGGPPASGSMATTYARELVDGFGFARTFANEIELFLRGLDGDVHLGNRAQVLAFADRCLRQRLDASRALEVAEALYRGVADLDEDDLAPRLGIARCLESGFRFDEAFALYEELAASFSRRPEIAVRRGRLETRFLLTGAAESSYLEALRYDGSSWEANWAFGEFLLAAGREGEAVDHLAKASQFLPSDADLQHDRIAVRNAHGTALLQAGRAAEAFKVFVQARKADASSQHALAGQIGAMILDPTLGATNGDALPAWLSDRMADDRPEEGVGFELLLASGLWALEEGDELLARDRLIEAARVDPLRAGLAWRALSWLAEVTGNSAEAWRFIEQAFEADPTDAWTRYQRGRLLAQQDDLEGAAAAFQSALEVELDFTDALVARGDLSYREGAFEDAERYLERALFIEQDRADVLVLRGLNFLELERVRDAQQAFGAARDADRGNPTGWAGLAWCQYRLGDPTEAQVQLGELQERFRNDTDAAGDRSWAAEQVERIADHGSKEAWVDDFERASLRNGWNKDERFGPQVSMVDGYVRVEGLFSDGGEARVWQEVKAAFFVSFEASVWVSSDSAVEAGLFVARDRGSGRESERIAGVSVSRHKDGTLQWSVVRPGMPEDPVEVPWLDDFQTGEWVRLRIERHSDPTNPDERGDSRVTITVDGTPIAENVKMADLGRSQTDVKIGLYVRGEQARTASVRMDDVEIVRRK